MGAFLSLAEKIMTKLINPPLGSAVEKSSLDLPEVLRMLAHKLSQPVTTLRGSVEVALMGELNESECRRVLELSLQESHRMAEILETLRNVLELEGPSEELQPILWTQSVERWLAEATSVNKDGARQLVSKIDPDIWVKASFHPLDLATERLLSGAIGAACGNHDVRIELSGHGEMACLSVNEAGMLHNANAAVYGMPPPIPELLQPGGLDEWIIRRAIERQGGWLDVVRISESELCYRLNIPLAFAGQAVELQTP
jgi:signal transduction histidine kinase